MSRLDRLGVVLRTLRPLRARQLLAQGVHAFRGVGEPVRVPGPAPVLAVPQGDYAFLPAPAHARLHAGHDLELIGKRVDFGLRPDWDHSADGPLFAYHLHQFDYLRADGLDPRRRAEWMLDWIARHPAGTGWDPHPISLRVLGWAKLLLTPGALTLEPDEEERLHLSLACQVETLSRHLEYRLQANHLLSNLIGVVFGGLLMKGDLADRWLGRTAALRSELADQIGADGGHVERSPMYHSLLLENVLDLLALARARGAAAPVGLVAELEDVAARMGGALQALTHPDGEIALFSDSAFGIAHTPASLLGYAERLGAGPRGPARFGLLAEMGYVRLETGPFVLMASVAGPQPPHQPGHAHCDALAFELSCGDQRIVTDTGVFEYVEGTARDLARTTASHATAMLGGAEQAEVWSAHRVGGRPNVVLESAEPPGQAVASCRGWSTPGSLHRRHFTARGEAFEIVDERIGHPLPVRLTLPLAPGLEPRLAHDSDGGVEAHVRLHGGRHLRVQLPVAASWRIEQSPYFPSFSQRVLRACIVGEAEDFESGTWRIELMS